MNAIERVSFTIFAFIPVGILLAVFLYIPSFSNEYYKTYGLATPYVGMIILSPFVYISLVLSAFATITCLVQAFLKKKLGEKK